MGIEERELATRGVRAYIRSELGKVEVQLYTLCHKYGIKSIYELERAIEKGEVVESDVLDDLISMDYLEFEKTKLKRLLRAV
jgi:hypothetical protein